MRSETYNVKLLYLKSGSSFKDRFGNEITQFFYWDDNSCFLFPCSLTGENIILWLRMLVSQSQIMIKYQNCRKHYTSPAIVVRQIKSEVQGISYYSGYFYTSLTYLILAGPVDLYNRVNILYRPNCLHMILLF